MSVGRDPGGQEIVVPGSTSNVGPGFDAVGLALQIALRLRIRSRTEDGLGALRCRFTGSPLVGENAIERGFRHGVATFAPESRATPSFDVEVSTDIPMRAGLGSSATALVAGLRLAEIVAGPQPLSALLAAACALEGHPDNTSASLLGGFVVAAQLEDGGVMARASDWPSWWPLVVATPALALETARARAALPAMVSLEDAVFNVQRTALLVDAVGRQDPASMRAALRDRLHQTQRAPLVPGLTEALQWSADGLIGVFLSGAGPSIAAIVDERKTGSVREMTERFGDLFSRLSIPATIRTLRAHPRLAV